MSRRDLTRRDALRRGFGGVAFVCSFNLDKFARPVTGTTAAGRRRKLAAAFDPFRADLPLPPVLAPARRAKRRDEYAITMKPGVARILPGLDTPVMGYEGSFPGPTIRAQRGRAVRVTQTNALPEELVVHLHGGLTPPDSDGHPAHVIRPGASRVYDYPNAQPGATLWYHNHGHGNTGRTVYQGLAAFYLLDDADEQDLDLPAGEHDIPLMIADRSFNADGSFRYRFDVEPGFRGDTILVNGAIAPRLRVQRRRYRFRILNASNARPYELVLGNGRTMTQIGSDAGLLPHPVARKVIAMHPAERVDVVIDFSQFGAGAKVVLHNAAGEGNTTAVMRFDVVGGGGKEEFRVPRRLRPLERLPRPNEERTWPLDIGGLATPTWRIDGLSFGTDRIDCRPRLGTSELWTFVNDSVRAHPMHLHGCRFRVVSQGGKKPHPGDAAWKDTVPVLPGETVTVQPSFDGFAGRYVFHCHNSEHGDRAMMGNMEVVA
jgi:FtsP/CotA-like multicopper oxidase with cupredoxin domain